MSLGSTYMQLIRMNIASRFEHRENIILQGMLEILNFAFLILFIEIVLSRVNLVSGWSKEQMQFLGSIAQIISILYSSFLAGGIARLQEGVRTGSFDFILLKPLDSQLYVSISRFNPIPLIGIAGPFVWIFYLIVNKGIPIMPERLPLTVLLMLAALVIRYSFGLGTAILSFILIKVSALQSLQVSIFEQSHYPYAIFSGWIKTFVVYVVPVALLANAPVANMTGWFNPSRGAVFLILYAAVSLTACRFFYCRLISKYTSASS